MTPTRLLMMVNPLLPGFEGMLNTFWVLQSDGKTLRHTTAMQTELKVTLAKDAKVEDFFVETESMPVPVDPDADLNVVKFTDNELSAAIEAFNVAEWSPEGRPPLKNGVMLDGGPHGHHSGFSLTAIHSRRKLSEAERVRGEMKAEIRRLEEQKRGTT